MFGVEELKVGFLVKEGNFSKLKNLLQVFLEFEESLMKIKTFNTRNTFLSSKWRIKKNLFKIFLMPF